LDILFEFGSAEFAVIVAIEQFVHASSVLDRFERGLVQQDDHGLFLLLIGCF
jgi:hypothetical protein